jgi:hypothetical protein
MSLLPRLATLRLGTLFVSVLALLLLTFGSTSVDVYRPVVATASNMAEVPTEEVAHETVSSKATSTLRVQLARRRNASGSRVFIVAAARPLADRARRASAARPVDRTYVAPRPSGSAPTPQRC